MENNVFFNNNEISEIRKKLTFIGASKTGKSTFLHRIVDNHINKDLDYLPTPGAYYSSLKIKNEYGNFDLDLWDSGGLEKYYSLVKHFYKDANAILIFYDPYDVSSFDRVKRHINDFKKENIYSAFIVLIRSRYDECLKNNDNKIIVSDEEALKFADSNNIYFTHLSNFEKYETGINELMKIV